jgi:hypothetical protein
MIRPAILADVDAIFDLAIALYSQYPQLKPDLVKIRKGIIQAISSAKHFAWISESPHEGLKGVLIGLTSENLWAQRKNCFVPLWYSERRGDGAKLLRAFKIWVQSRRAIQVAGFVADSKYVDSRAWLLAERIGFKRCVGAYLLYN